MRIIFFADMHFPYSKLLDDKLLKARDELYFPFLDKVFSLQSDMVISLGDLVLSGYKEEMDEVYSKAKGNFYHILGNHDRAIFCLKELIDGKFRYGDSFFEYEFCDVLLLETAKDKNQKDWGGELSSLQISWLKECIDKNLRKPLLIFAHHPVFDTVRKSNYNMFSLDKNCEILDILEKRQNLVFYISGHTHTDDIIRDKNLVFISASCIIDARMVRILEIYKDEIYYKSVDFTTSKDMVAAEILSKNVEGFNFSKYGVGGTLETNARFKYE